MKRFLAALLCITMVFSLASCGSSSSKSDAASTASSSKSSSDSGKSGSDSKSDGSSSPYAKYLFNKGELVRITNDENEALVPELTIDGIIITGNRQEKAKSIEEEVKDGYKTSGINADFWLNEYMSLYVNITTNAFSDVKVICVPRKDMETYLTKSLSDMTSEAESNGAVVNISEPDVENYNYIGDFYVGPADEKQPGSYDILFYCKGKLAYYLPIELTKEPVE